MAITPDSKRAYVTNNADGTVSVITTSTGAVSLPSPSATVQVGWRSLLTAERAYVTNNADGTVSVITTATGAVFGAHHRRKPSDRGGDHS